MMQELSLQAGAKDSVVLVLIASFMAAVLSDYVCWICDGLKQVLSFHGTGRDRA